MKTLKFYSFQARKHTVKYHHSSRPCEAFKCKDHGSFQAPRQKDNHYLNKEEAWFCKKHIQLYNSHWDYFSEMSKEEIIKRHEEDIFWNRPTWPLGDWHNKRKIFNDPSFFKQTSDPFDLFKEKSSREKIVSSAASTEQKALALLDLSYPFDKQKLQAAYRKKVKVFHPDINSGCTKSEEIIKQVNQAYTILKRLIK